MPSRDFILAVIVCLLLLLGKYVQQKMFTYVISYNQITLLCAGVIENFNPDSFYEYSELKLDFVTTYPNVPFIPFAQWSFSSFHSLKLEFCC